jgi:hypothetical protein
MSTHAEQVVLYARDKRLSEQTLARWRRWTEADQSALLTLAQELHLSENHLRDFLDWLEEISLRDGSTIHDLLTRPEITRLLKAKLGRNDKLKAVKAALYKLRYPHFSRLEESLRTAVKTLDLGSRVRVSFPPALEGDEITLELKVRNETELRESLARLQQRLDDGVWQQVFDLLDQV